MESKRTQRIVSRWDESKTLFECEVPDEIESGLAMRYALERATEIRADLRDADLRGADLRGANLLGANLSDADLSDADLSGANLHRADLSDADLSDADLSGANLLGANLSDADLRGADLSGADLSGANLHRANLLGANLSDANLLGFRVDFWDVLLRAPHEIAGVREALIEGRVDGSTYSGECACLVGTIGNVRGVDYAALGNGIKPDSGRPAEQWFMGIRKGDTPETNQQSRLAVEWLDELTGLLALHKAA